MSTINLMMWDARTDMCWMIRKPMRIEANEKKTKKRNIGKIGRKWDVNEKKKKKMMKNIRFSVYFNFQMNSVVLDDDDFVGIYLGVFHCVLWTRMDSECKPHERQAWNNNKPNETKSAKVNTKMRNDDDGAVGT